MNMSGALPSRGWMTRIARPRGRSQSIRTSPSTEFHWKLIAFERDFHGSSYRAVSAIASHDIAKIGFLAGTVRPIKSHVHAIVVLSNGNEGHRSFNRNPKPEQVLGKNTLGLILRQAESRLGEVR